MDSVESQRTLLDVNGKTVTKLLPHLWRVHKSLVSNTVEINSVRVKETSGYGYPIFVWI
jgi:DNA-binding LytR/AlgR family response regulator